MLLSSLNDTEGVKAIDEIKKNQDNRMIVLYWVGRVRISI